MPENDQPRLFMPIPSPAEIRGLDGWHSNNDYQMWAKLRPGVSIDRARAENNALNAALASEHSFANMRQLVEDLGYRTLIEPARDDLVRDVRATLCSGPGPCS